MAVFDLVFEGGGAKGSVFAGAMEVFYAAQHTPGRLVGTSAGAITAALIAAGYTPAEMLEAVTEQRNGRPRFASFMDPPVASEFDPEFRDSCQLAAILKAVPIPGVPDWIEKRVDAALLGQLLERSDGFRQMFSFIECGGLYSGTEFVNWLDEKLGRKGVAQGCTLAQLNALKGCDLSLVATDTTNREMLVLNHRTSPDVPVSRAVRMSMSIPFVWREVIWRAEWGTYLGMDKAGAKIVDGGVLSNFPIDLIATANERARKIMGRGTNPEAALNLGLLIDEEMEVPGIDPKPARTNRLQTVRRIQRLVDAMMGSHDNVLIRDFADQICRCPAKGYGTTEFDMPSSKITALVEAGRAAMRAHLASRNIAGAQTA